MQHPDLSRKFSLEIISSQEGVMVLKFYGVICRRSYNSSCVVQFPCGGYTWHADCRNMVPGVARGGAPSTQAHPKLFVSCRDCVRVRAYLCAIASSQEHRLVLYLIFVLCKCLLGSRTCSYPHAVTTMGTPHMSVHVLHMNRTMGH